MNFMETPCLTDLQRLWSGLEGAKVSQNCLPKVSADVGVCLSLSPTTQVERRGVINGKAGNCLPYTNFEIIRNCKKLPNQLLIYL